MRTDGWLVLIKSELEILRLLAGLVVVVSFLVVLLVCQPYRRKSDFGMAASVQVLFVGVYLGGIVVRLYGDIANDTIGSPELAFRFLGLRSLDHAVALMITLAFTMLALLVASLGADTYMHIVQQRLTSKWSVCTMDPPHVGCETRTFALVPRGFERFVCVR